MLEHNDQLLNEIGDLLATHYETWKEQPPDRPEVAFGRYLAASRRQQQLSMAELAQRAGIPESEVLAYEHGLIPQSHIKAEPLQALATALAEEVDTFFLLLGVTSGVEPAPTPQLPGSLPPGHRFTPDGNQLVARLAPPPISPAPSRRVPLVGRVPHHQAVRRPSPAPHHPTLRIPAVAMPLVVLLVIFIVGAGQQQLFVAPPMLSTKPMVSKPTQADCLSLLGASQRNCPSTRLAHQPAPTAVVRIQPAIMGQGVAVTQAIQQATPVSVEPQVVAAMPSPVVVSSTAVAVPLAPTAIQASYQPQPATVTNSVPVTVAVAEELLSHQVEESENLWCIAKKYYDDGDLYPLLCQYNYGEPLCSQPLHPGDLLFIPVAADFAAKNLALDQLNPIPSGKLNQFRRIDRATINANSLKLRGVDYWCQDNDDEIYREGKPAESVAQANPIASLEGLP